MEEIIKACSPAPFSVSDYAIGKRAVISKKLWPVGKTIFYAYLDGAKSNKAKAVDDAIQTWETFANVILQRSIDIKTADIRISFSLDGSYSTIGIDALNVTDKTKPTMNFSWIENNYPPSTEDRGTILHEFGHALGMVHEFQNPARGKHIHLHEPSVYNYYRPILNNDDSLVKTEVIDVYYSSDLSNHSQLDLNSIMMYFMPALLNRECIDIRPNLELSQLDKAFITLTYPRADSDAVSQGGLKVLDALNIVNVPHDISAKILDLLNKNDLEGVRTAFNTYNTRVIALNEVNKALVDSVNVVRGGKFGVRDSVSKMVDNPLFVAILKNVIKKSIFDTRAIPTVNSTPGALWRI